MKKIICVVVLLAGIIPGYVRAQRITEFSQEHSKFLTELESLFKSLSVKEEKDKGEALMVEFIMRWNNGDFTPEIQENVQEICNLMLKRKLKTFPHFYNYLQSVVSIIRTNQPLNSYRDWHKTTILLVNDKKSSTPVTQFLDFSHLLFSKNILYESRSNIWKSSSKNYYFAYDSVPCVVFDEINLTCHANDDSTVIYHTKGKFYPLKSTWKGEGGFVYWLRAGFNESELNAELSNYEILLKFSHFKAEQVNLYYPQYFKKVLVGTLEEKVKADVTEEKASYPRFRSYFTHHKIDSLFQDIDFEGGLEIRGSKLIGQGDGKNDAMIIIKKDKKRFIKIASQNFIIRKDRISSNPASVTIYLKQDSIYHPNLEMTYVNDKRELSFIRSGEGLAESPFYNSFHKVEMYCEALYWRMDEPEFSFEMIKGISGIGRAAFESDHYFAAQRYHKLQGIDEINPLDVLKKYSETYNLREIPIDGLAQYMRKPKEQIILQMIDLASAGFVDYNITAQTVTVKDKLINYIDAINKKTDYDVIQFNSETYSHNNATMELDSFNLKLYGVPFVYLSDSQNVKIYLDNQQLILKRNRDFSFSGRVLAGLFDFWTRNSFFNYNQFKLEMPAIDSMSFFVQSFETDGYGRRSYVRVRNVISDLSGELLIDAPNNKSGLKNYPQYPIFTSSKNSYVYYDKKSIQKGVYKRDKFFFKVYPFTIDSLDNFSTDYLEFNGYLVSAGIFPDIEEALKVQPDYSLGFDSKTPPAGYSAYKKGTYYAGISLGNDGLRGNGSLEYLTSTSWSKDFVFYPDSCNALAQNFMVREQQQGVEYPAVKGMEVKEHWLPYENKMILRQTLFPFAMYNNYSELFGTLVLTPKELLGGGRMKFEKAEMQAGLYSFRHHEFFSDTADFSLKGVEGQIAFNTHDYRSHIDLHKRKGEFVSNGGTSLAEFPLNLFICNIDMFNWSMDKDEIAMGSQEKMAEMAALDRMTIQELIDVPLEGSKFTSIRPDQDSLTFTATVATFSLKDNIIIAEDVKYIRVADAAIFPADKQVIIQKGAVIKTFNNAKILANTVTKYHTVYDAIVDIHSRRKYWGVGSYDYVDETGYRQKIRLKKITTDDVYRSYGEGQIPDSLGFTLSNDFDFTGNVNLLASREFLNFDGGVRIRHTCATGKRAWIKFNSDINPNDIMIAITDSITDLENKRQMAALLFSNESSRFYSGFLSMQRASADQVVISAKGFLKFDKIAEDYIIAPPEKLKRSSLAGNQVALDRRKCILRCEGKLDFGLDMGMAKLETYGKATHYIIPDSTRFETVLMLDFPFEQSALDQMLENIIGQNLEGVDLTKPYFLKALTDILGEKEAEKIISDINLYNKMRRYPGELVHTLFFTHIKFKWDPPSRSFISMGKIGLGGIGKEQINRYVDGFVEISKKRTGDEIDIYIEFDKGKHWFYFNYRNNLLQTIASNQLFNTTIRDLKEEKRTVKNPKGGEDYRFIISTLQKKTDFLRKMKK